MKGRVLVLDRWNGRAAAALMVDGRLDDLLIDPPEDDGPRPGAIARAVADRPIKGQGGMILRLWGGQSGFLRQANGIAPGQQLLVQVTTHADEGKAAPVTTRLLIKGRAAILTPDAPGYNIARGIRDDDQRARLHALAEDAMAGAPDGIGLILRTAASGLTDADILDEIAELRAIVQAILSEGGDGGPELLLDAPDAHHQAWSEWCDPAPDQVAEADGAFASHGVLEEVDAASQPRVSLGNDAHIYIEPTRALVSVDVNTGGDFSYAAGLKANIAAMRDLPRQLRLRGLGGQVVIDMAPMAKKDRKSVEQALMRSLKADQVETQIVGWTPLGHLELQRKRDRLPLSLTRR